MNDYVLVRDKATGFTYPMPAARAAAGHRFTVLDGEAPYDRNGKLLAPVPTPKTPASNKETGTTAKATTAGKRPKEASND